MAASSVIDILSRILTGEFSDEQIEQIRNFLLAGIDISALMM